MFESRDDICCVSSISVDVTMTTTNAQRQRTTTFPLVYYVITSKEIVAERNETKNILVGERI